MSSTESTKSGGSIDSGASAADSTGTKSKYFTCIKTSVSQPSKRPHSEVANTSAEEMTLILTELGEIKEEMIKKDDLKTMVASIVNELMKVQKEEFETRIVAVEKKHKDDVFDLKERIDGLNLENEALREKLAEKSNEIRKVEETTKKALDIATDAQVRSNYNEQYSRKTNIKIYGMKENERENSTKEVIQMLRAEAKVELAEDEIVAAHRIPGRGRDRPILLKVKNTAIKSRIMKKRAVVKKSKQGLRLADDVTYLNSKLIERLNGHDLIDQAWYFNGSVYGKTRNSDRRIRFEICDDIAKKLKGADKDAQK